LKEKVDFLDIYNLKYLIMLLIDPFVSLKPKLVAQKVFG